MTETWYGKAEREAGEELKKLLDRPNAPSGDLIGVIDEKTDEPEYFDPWDLFPCFYGSYSSAFDDMALTVLDNLINNRFDGEELSHEMFREVLCNKNLCDYGTSPRVCFPTSELKKLLPEYIDRWKQYYKLQWGEEHEQ